MGACGLTSNSEDDVIEAIPFGVDQDGMGSSIKGKPKYPKKPNPNYPEPQLASTESMVATETQVIVNVEIDYDSDDDIEIDIKKHFKVSKYDEEAGKEKKFEFSQRDFDQGIISNPKLVKGQIDMAHHFPIPLRLVRFPPNHPGYACFTIRKCTISPWDVQDGGHGGGGATQIGGGGVIQPYRGQTDGNDGVHRKIYIDETKDRGHFYRPPIGQ